MGKEIVRKILERVPKKWSSSELADHVEIEANVCHRTAFKYVAYYTKDENEDKPDYLIKEGVVHRYIGKRSIFYAEEYKQKLDKELKREKGEKIRKHDIDKIKELIDGQKDELGDENFKLWIENKIRELVYSLVMGKGFILYEIGEVFNPFQASQKVYPLNQLEKWKQRMDEELRFIERWESESENRKWLDAFLTHPNEEIRDIAIKYYLQFKNEREKKSQS